jgi:arginine deiminase
MNRRVFLGTAVAGMAAPAFGRDGRRRARGAGTVPSDVAPLRKVLVHEPGPEARKAMTVSAAVHPFQSVDLLGPDAPAQHAAMVARLREAGAEVLTFLGVLDSAIVAARAAGQFAPWLGRHAPELAEREAELDAAGLIGARDELVYHADPREGGLRMLVHPLQYLLYVRDLAVMTPRGLVLSNLINKNRRYEVDLFRLALRWSPELAGYPVALDAGREGVLLQGGDLIVADERTLLLGVGNLTEESAAKRMAQKLEMDVVAVQLPSAGRVRKSWPFADGNGLRIKFLHLDTIMSLVGPDAAVAVPYFLEADFAGRDPLANLLRSMADEPGNEGPPLHKLADSLVDVGLVRLYRAGSGSLDPAVEGLKLVDYLRHRGYRVTFVGGDRPASEALAAKHMVESVLHEARFQAANVLALGPNRLVAPSENALTVEALRAQGVEVRTFPAGELVHWNGGAHCLTLPLERG